MALLVAGLGLAIVAIAVYGLVAPSGLLQLVARMGTTRGLWTAAVSRVVFGALLWLAAPASRTPFAFELLGAIAIFAGVALPLVGLARFRALVGWVAAAPPGAIRLWTVFALAFGAFLAWSVLV